MLEGRAAQQRGSDSLVMRAERGLGSSAMPCPWEEITLCSRASWGGLAGEQLCRKGPGCAGAQQVDKKSTGCSCSKDSHRYHGLYQQEYREVQGKCSGTDEIPWQPPPKRSKIKGRTDRLPMLGRAV